MYNPKECPICKGGCRHESVPSFHNIVRYFCEDCGTFLVEHLDEINELRGPRGIEHPYQLSAILKEQEIKGLPPVFFQFGKADYPYIEGTFAADANALIRSRWPSTVPERLDRLLLNLGRMQEHPGKRQNVREYPLSALFSRDVAERYWHLSTMSDEGLITYEQTSHTDGVQLTAKRWTRFAELTETNSSPRRPAFVAMWFGRDDATRSAMKSAYDDGILPGVEDSGYHATRVDLEEHNEYIMDKILADILVAPFLVADFTGHRNGVYFEAGIARGRGIPVINCCRRDSFKDAHFDTKQLNHIVWETPKELGERLTNRILGTIGRGPYTDE